MKNNAVWSGYFVSCIDFENKLLVLTVKEGVIGLNIPVLVTRQFPDSGYFKASCNDQELTVIEATFFF